MAYLGTNAQPNKLSQNGGKIIPDSCISSGTLKTDDLLRTFADELERLNPFGDKDLIAEARDYADDFHIGHPGNNDAASECLSDLIARIQQACPDGVWFGASEEDGACFGYWTESDQD